MLFCRPCRQLGNLAAIRHCWLGISFRNHPWPMLKIVRSTYKDPILLSCNVNFSTINPCLVVQNQINTFMNVPMIICMVSNATWCHPLLSIATAPRQVGVSHARLLFAVGSHSPGLWSCLAENVSSLESGRVRVQPEVTSIYPSQSNMTNDFQMEVWTGKSSIMGISLGICIMNTLIIILLLTKKSMTSGWWKGGKTLGFP